VLQTNYGTSILNKTNSLLFLFMLKLVLQN
jgi:hypothetical protein